MNQLSVPTPFGVAGEAVGYLFAGDLLSARRDAIGFGCGAFHVSLIDRDLANEIIIARHYSRRIYRGSIRRQASPITASIRASSGS